MTENVSIASVVAVFISLLLEWFPALKTRWDTFNEGQKRGMMAAAVMLISLVVVLGNCYWWGEVCPESWVVTVRELFLTFLAAASVQQGVHRLLKRTE